MKVCPEYRELILQQALGALAADATHRLRAHLESCAGCREFAARATSLCDTVTKTAAQLPAPAPPPAFHARLAQRIHADAEQRQLARSSRVAEWFTLPRIGFAAACGVVLMGAVMLVNRGQRPDPAITSAPSTLTDDAPPTLLAYQRAFNESFEQFDALTLRDDNRLAMDGASPRSFGAGAQF